MNGQDDVWEYARRAERAKRLFHFLPQQLGVTFADLKGFHEWCATYAEQTFKAKQTHAPICLYVLHRGGDDGGLNILETQWESEQEKAQVMRVVRELLNHPISKDFRVDMMATINEVWIAANYGADRKDLDELMAQYGQVRNFPDREDGLMVASYHRNGGVMITKWTAKIKKDPQKSYLLARDDEEFGPDVRFAGRHAGYFEPEKDTDEVFPPAGDPS